MWARTALVYGVLLEADLIGLQVLGECGEKSMCELILDEGTVLLQADSIKNCQPTRVAGWKFEASPGRPGICQANETHSLITQVHVRE